MAEVIWSEPAVQQLDTIASYIALDKPDAARGVVRRIIDATDRLEHFKSLGKNVPEGPHPNSRPVWFSPCWIDYRLDGNDIRILHVRRGEQPFRMEDLIEEE